MPKKISKKPAPTASKKGKAAKSVKGSDEIVGVKEPLEENILDDEETAAPDLDPETLEAALDDEEFAPDMDTDEQW